MPRQTTCTFHCSVCGTSFHSLEAFDSHRRGDYRSNDPELGGHCVHPFDLDGKLVALTEHGVCRVARDGVKHDVMIWTDSKGLTQMRDRMAAGRSPQAQGAHDEQASACS